MRRAATRGLAIEALGRPDVDLERPESVRAAIAERRPQVVINAAAYTAVDTAEDETERAFLINAGGAEAIADAAARGGAQLIHVSTDYVFAGYKAAPYLEEDETGPRSVYGASKLEGERLVRAAHPGAVIVRTAWVFDAAGANFVRTMLRLAKSRAEVSVVGDQLGCPT
ncbi:MAG TPA: sugar nucleotide-binding protein, partial [Opitutus sp.]|nr:sugar nucleotide-binding protein [Opitutus sp.]